MKHALLFLLLSVILSACAMGRTTEYRGTSSFDYDYKNDAPIIIGTQDQRPYVLSGDKDETFVGLTRSLYGIPYSMTTKSGDPLAEDFGGLIAATLRKKGYDATAVRIPPSATENEAVAKITKPNGDTYLYLRIKEWKTDTYIHPTLTYALTLSVLDGTGNALRVKALSGEDDLGRDQRPERQNLAAAVSDILGSLLNSDEIHAALSEDSTKQPGAEKALEVEHSTKQCSVDQVIKLTKLGMTDQQIKAACNN